MTTGSLKCVHAQERILEWIRSGKIANGERLASERALAEMLGMNHQTVRRALAALAEQGVVVKRSRVGNFVRAVETAELATPVVIALPSYMAGVVDSLDSTSGESTDATGLGAHPVPSLVMAGATRVFQPHEYSLSIFYYGPQQLWFDAGQVLTKRQIRGLLLWPDSRVTPEDIQRLEQGDVRVVLLKRAAALVGLGLPCVHIDKAMALRQTLDGLLRLGHRHIRVALYKLGSGAKDCDNVIELFCQQTRICDPATLKIEIPNMGLTADYRPLRRIFEQGPIPTAVIADDEFTAREIFRLCYGRDIKIPDDMSLAALTNNAPHVHPVALTSPDTPAITLRAVETAARQLETSMKGDPPMTGEIHVSCNVTWRASTGPVLVRESS